MFMRGNDIVQPSMFYQIDLESRIPAAHPLRKIKAIADQALRRMDRAFDAVYSEHGRASIPPEQLMRALILQMLYSIRSERLLVEQIDFSLLFRWFVGLTVDEGIWNHATFSKNRDRFTEGELFHRFMAEIVEEARRHQLLSSEHFSVDGTLLEAWASQKSFQRKDGTGTKPGAGRNGTRNFHEEQRSNDTHESTTDPESRLCKKSRGDASRLAYQGNIVIENRNGLVVAAEAVTPDGTTERTSALRLLRTLPRRRRATVAADKGYDATSFIHGVRALGMTPHVAAKSKGSALTRRTTRHLTYAISQVARKRVEEPFGWGKSIAHLRKLKHRGRQLVDAIFVFTMATYNVVRLSRLVPVA